MTEDVREQIRRFVAEHANGVRADDDEELFGTGLVNSLFAVQLVMWIERRFGVHADGADLDFANFATVAAIDSFVRRKRAGV
ncbi:acyl carrier protein [Actinoallomurus sp. CA-142502]|uniref:acyl carrier protein n=1 Tax=Actinoallomurus sp. CA-142502 TaxID=3239885 RepID=UPI003D914412